MTAPPAAGPGRTDILGVGFDGVTAQEAVRRAEELIRCRAGAYICTPNPEIVMLCRRDRALRAAVGGASLVLPDGVGIVWASRVLGTPLPERVTGIDLFTALLEQTRSSLYLLGGQPGAADAAAGRIVRQYPGITIAGTAHGYFEDEDAAAAAVRACAPDIAAVCLGSPKQELFMARRDLGGALCLGLGGAIDVLAGRVERAPAAWQERGLEWLWRLLLEPRRIRRQIRLPGFAAAVMIQRIRKLWKKEN